jgi:hypothetical protein
VVHRGVAATDRPTTSQHFSRSCISVYTGAASCSPITGSMIISLSGRLSSRTGFEVEPHEDHGPDAKTCQNSYSNQPPYCQLVFRRGGLVCSNNTAAAVKKPTPSHGDTVGTGRYFVLWFVPLLVVERPEAPGIPRHVTPSCRVQLKRGSVLSTFSHQSNALNEQTLLQPKAKRHTAGVVLMGGACGSAHMPVEDTEV